MRRKKKRELSTRARRRGPFSALSRLYDLLTQSVFLVIIFIALAYFVNNLVMHHIVPENEEFKISEVRLMPADDPDVQNLLAHVNAKSGDIYNDLNLNSLKASLLVFQWIDDVRHHYSDDNILSVFIDRKVPVCEFEIAKDEDGGLVMPMRFVDRNCEAFDASSEEYREALGDLPVLTFYSADSKPLSLPQFRSAVGFIEKFSENLGQAERKFAIQKITYINNTWNIVLSGEMEINISDRDPVSYIPYIQRALDLKDVRISLENYSLYFDNHFTAVLRPKPESIIDIVRL